MDHRVVDKKLQILRQLEIELSQPIEGWQFRTAENPEVGKYEMDGGWQRIETPARFPAGKTVFLKTRFTVPESVELKDTYLSFGFEDLEGLLFVDGEPYAGLDALHDRVPVPRAGALQIEIEFTSVPALWRAPELAAHGSVFSGSSICVVNRKIEQLYYDVRFAWETARVSADPRRKPLLETAIETALLAVDLTSPRQRLLREVGRARRMFRQQLAAIGPDPEAGGIYAVGHTHIDVAWLWPLRETVRKCSRTFSTACRLMERYPHFRFTCSQAQLYQYTKENYPALYRQIKKWVKSGRWETAGAMWVEADCNATSGESLVRQILHGLRFFHQEFGTRPRICWLPDVFGYPSSLPEILAGCGVEYFYTYKLHWQAENPFPHSLFHWRGLDGTEVLAHVVNHLGAYNNRLDPEHMSVGWDRYAQKAEYPEVIFPFGAGDGGGGVSEELLEMYKRAEGRFPGLPAVRIGTAESFFDQVVEADPDLPVWDGELYVQTHRGTYTTQSATKRANRQGELLLRDAEIFGSLALLAGKEFPTDSIDEAWKQILLLQFHDILPGSSIDVVYDESRAEYARALATAQQVAEESVAAIVSRPGRGKNDGICVFNSLSWPRQDVFAARIPDWEGPISLIGPDGARHPVQVVSRGDGEATILCRGGAVPATGYALYSLSDRDAGVEDELSVSPTRLENRFIRLTLNRQGGVIRLYDKINRRDIIPRGAVGNDLQLFQDGPEREDAWNIHETSDKRRYPFEGQTTVRVIETGPVRGLVRVERVHRHSCFEQDIAIYGGSNRIDFITRVDWQERQTMLKVAFPLEVRTTRATYEVQFGAYERPTHRNTSWDQQKFEVPGQQWADLSEAGYGVSLLNDSRYGYDVKDHVLRLTLLRSTIWPDPQADRGQHEFTYALLPHAGSWVEGETVRRAWELNAPARAFPVRLESGADRARSFISFAGAAAVLQALKPAEDGRGLILRLYEPNGGRGELSVRVDFPVCRVLECNLVEEDAGEVALRKGTFRVAIRPFQIRTFRLLTD